MNEIKYTILYCVCENFCDSILLLFRLRLDKKLRFRFRRTAFGISVRKSNQEPALRQAGATKQ
jgi:hypothetical protein